ncbi:MAG: tetratricopeptide repeat protein [Bacteroidota bacterium]
MKNPYLLVLACFFLITHLHAQKDLDSLSAIFASDVPYERRLDACLQLVQELHTVDSSQAMVIIQKGLKLAAQSDQPHYQLKFQVQKARIRLKQKAYTSATALLKEVEEAAEAHQLTEIQAEANFFLGHVYLSQELHEEALFSFQHSYNFYQRVGDHVGMGKCLLNIGGAHHSQGEIPEALELYKKSLAIGKKISESSIVFKALKNIGNIHLAQGNYPEALDYYKKAQQLASKLGEKKQIAFILYDMGNIYLNLGDYPSAIRNYEEGLTLSRVAGLQEQEAYGLHDLGNVFANQGNYEKALSYYEEALVLGKKAAYKKLIISILYNFGNTLFYQGKYEEALAHYDQSLNLCQEMKLTEGVGDNYVKIGNVYAKLGNYEEALSYYEQSFDIRKGFGDQAGLAECLHDIAKVHKNQGNDIEALARYQESLAICEEIGFKMGISYNINQIGDLHLKQGNYTQALEYYKKCYRLSQELNHQKEIARLLSHQGRAFLLNQQEDSAFVYFQASISLCEKMGYYVMLKDQYNQLGEWHTSRGQLTQALAYYDQALQVTQEVRDTVGLAEVNSHISKVFYMQEQFDKSLLYQEKALEGYQNTNHKSGIAHSYSAMASIYNQNKEYDLAMKYAFLALQRFQALKDSCSFSTCFLTIGSAYHAGHNHDLALQYLILGQKQSARCKQDKTLALTSLALGKLYKASHRNRLSFQAFRQALTFAEKSQNRPAIKEAAAHLHPLYLERGELEEAYQTLQIYYANKDALFNEANTRKLVEREMQFTFEQEQQEQKLDQERRFERQQWIIYTIIGACLALLSIALIAYQNYRNKYRANELLKEQNEQISLQKEKLEALDHMKSRFFTNISHELRTPLTLISSPIQHILHTEQNLPLKISEPLQLMLRNTRQLKGLVNDIMDLAKLESNKAKLQEKPILIKSFLNRAASNFESLAHHLDIHYHLQLDIPSGMAMMMDAPKVEKIVNNLLSNAIKHTPSQQTVSICAQMRGAQLAITVKDTGTGIKPEDLPHIFDRYYQSKQEHDTLQGGTGIGLALVKELTDIMQGKLIIDSEYGQGSTFTLLLPFRSACLHGHDEGVEETWQLSDPAHFFEKGNHGVRACKKHRVLIVEDHPDMQRFVESLLAEKYHTLMASNGKQALEILRTETVDLVVSDVMMPEMDGYTLLERMKQDEVFQYIPVVMLTALDSEDCRLRALTVGVDDYLTKPFSPQEIMARVDNLIHRYEARREMWQEILNEKLQGKQGVIEEEIVECELKSQPIQNEWLKQVEAIIKRELENPDFRLAELASSFHLSERQFQRRIKACTGLSPKKYQQEIALQRGRALLEKRAYGNVTAIAYSVGMSNVSRFSKLYEARFGKKPSAYFRDILHQV